MGYLNYLPKFEYTLGKFRGVVSDIFRRVAFTQKSRQNPQNYNEKIIESVYSPDRLASDELLNSEYYWQILMMNNIISENEFPESYEEYTQEVNDLKNGTSLSFERFFGSDPKIGDVMYSITAGNTVDFNSGGVVSKYDSILRKVDMKYVFGDGFSGAGASAALYGNDDSGNFTEKGKLEFQRKTTTADSVSYFFDSNNRETSPYLYPSGLEGGTFTDPLAITPENGSLLSTYLSGSNLPTGFFFRTELQDFSDENMQKRNIKIPSREIADKIATEAERLLREGIRSETNTITGLVQRVGATTSSTSSSVSSSGGGGSSSY